MWNTVFPLNLWQTQVPGKYYVVMEYFLTLRLDEAHPRVHLLASSVQAFAVTHFLRAGTLCFMWSPSHFRTQHKTIHQSDWFKEFSTCQLPGAVRSLLATGGRFQPFYWPTSVTSGVRVCAPSCPNWRTSRKSTDLSAGTKPRPRWDVIVLCLCVSSWEANTVLNCDFFLFRCHPHTSFCLFSL